MIWSLLILYVCPLTKKLSVYHFNGRFIWTVRDIMTTKRSRKRIQKKSYKLICILMSELNIWPLCKRWLSTWWQNSCCQSQRSDLFCSWPPGLHTSQEGFCPLFFTDPLQVNNVSRLMFGNSNTSAPSTDFLWDDGLETGSATPGP